MRSGRAPRTGAFRCRSEVIAIPATATVARHGEVCGTRAVSYACRKSKQQTDGRDDRRATNPREADRRAGAGAPGGRERERPAQRPRRLRNPLQGPSSSPAPSPASRGSRSTAWCSRQWTTSCAAGCTRSRCTPTPKMPGPGPARPRPSLRSVSEARRGKVSERADRRDTTPKPHQSANHCTLTAVQSGPYAQPEIDPPCQSPHSAPSFPEPA